MKSLPRATWAVGALAGIRLRSANAAAGSRWLPRRLRVYILRCHGLQIQTFAVRSELRLSTARNFRVGRRTFINEQVFVDDAALVHIGADCDIGPRCVFVTSSHELGPTGKRAGTSTTGPIYVNEGCWLGAGVTVLGNVTIGEGCVIAAGAVVIGDCAPNGLYAGIPARRLKDLEEI